MDMSRKYITFSVLSVAVRIIIIMKSRLKIESGELIKDFFTPGAGKSSRV
jgi:hypothetical protein